MVNQMLSRFRKVIVPETIIVLLVLRVVIYHRKSNKFKINISKSSDPASLPNYIVVELANCEWKMFGVLTAYNTNIPMSMLRDRIKYYFQG